MQGYGQEQRKGEIEGRGQQRRRAKVEERDKDTTEVSLRGVGRVSAGVRSRRMDRDKGRGGDIAKTRTRVMGRGIDVEIAPRLIKMTRSRAMGRDNAEVRL